MGEIWKDIRGYEGLYSISNIIKSACIAKNKYSSQIEINKKRIHLGIFKTAELAHQAYINARKLYNV